MEKEKKKKSEEKNVKTKKARAALAGKGMCCSHYHNSARCTCGN